MDQGVNITSLFFSLSLYDPRLRTDRKHGGGMEGREGEIPALITSWVTAPAGRCQNPTLSDVGRALENERVRIQRPRMQRTLWKSNEDRTKKKEFFFGIYNMVN